MFHMGMKIMMCVEILVSEFNVMDKVEIEYEKICKRWEFE